MRSLLLDSLGISYQIPFIPLLHGAGGPYDEIIIFGGFGSLLIFLGYLSWRVGEEKGNRSKRGKRKRKN
jgi:hypothetical protein